MCQELITSVQLFVKLNSKFIFINDKVAQLKIEKIRTEYG